ncbi:hypothetical protein [Paenibacillus sp. y28]|uniref:hypothetical protein n=1 Tax=Paenibacillus sp. y28 TaxID=3129110 RepID=UPI0030185713
MKQVLIIGVEKPAFEGEGVVVADMKAAEHWLLREMARAILVTEQLAAELIELRDLMGFKSDIIVLVKEDNARQTRLWRSYGVDEVWLISEWEQRAGGLFEGSTATSHPATAENTSMDEKVPDSPEEQSAEAIATKAKSWFQRWRPVADEEGDADFTPIPPAHRFQPLSRHPGTIVIGVGGLMRRSGTTHAAIRLAQTLAVRGEKVACVEVLQGAGPLVCLATLVTSLAQSVGGDQGFSLDGVDYFPDQTLDQYIELIGGQYSYVVADFGPLYETSAPWLRLEWKRTALKFMCMGASPWDFQVFAARYDGAANVQKSGSLNLVQFADETVYKQLVKVLPSELQENTRMIPFDPQIQNFAGLKRSVYADLLGPVLPKALIKRKFI